MLVGRESSRLDEESLDRLAGEWWIHQLRYGHRYNSDDVLVAWTALLARPGARRLLDLGAGTGSIGLLTLLCLPGDARLTAVEVQAVSAGLLRRTVAHNRLDARVCVVESDLRCLRPEQFDARFELITGNPPYLPPANASASPHPQRAAARLELHGDVFDYCRVVATLLAPDGRFCFCHRPDDPRPEQAIAAAGLFVLERREVVFRAGRGPGLALFTCGWQGERMDAEPLLLRLADGRRSDAFRAVRRRLWIEA